MDYISLLKITEKKINHLIQVLAIKEPKTPRDKRAVFFDIDGTISRNNCYELLINEVVQRGLLDVDTTVIFEQKRKLWKTRECDFDEYEKTVVEMQDKLTHFSEDVLEKLATDIFKREGYYYLFPWLLLLKFKMMGYELIAVSGAPSFMAKAYLNRIGFFCDKIHASEFIFSNGFLAKVDNSVFRDKGAFIEKVYGKEYNLKKCVAIGDTFSDSKMLRKVGHPIAMNPTIDLANEAGKNKWTVVIERKNLVLIYKDGKILE